MNDKKRQELIEVRIGDSRDYENMIAELEEDIERLKRSLESCYSDLHRLGYYEVANAYPIQE